MRFLHTADWQIGMKAAHAGAAAPRVREARLESARRAVEVARARGAEFFLLAGDTFEHNAVDRALVQKVGDILAGFGGPVYVLPGNHDPLEIGSVWEHPVWSAHSRLQVLREPGPVAVPGGVLWACPVTDRFAQRDPTAWVPPAADGGIRIGAAHGTVEGNPAAEPALPIARNAAERGGLDYLALGHWHSAGLYETAPGVVRMAYSGTHEPAAFGERDSGNVLLVEIAAPGAIPRVEIIPTAALEWQICEERLMAPGQLAGLRGRLESAPLTRPTLIEVRLSGLLFAGEAAEVPRIGEIVASRFLYGRLDTSMLAPAPGDDTWISELPRGFLREAAERLRELAAGDPAASRALGELFALGKEVAR